MTGRIAEEIVMRAHLPVLYPLYHQSELKAVIVAHRSFHRGAESEFAIWVSSVSSNYFNLGQLNPKNILNNKITANSVTATVERPVGTRKQGMHHQIDCVPWWETEFFIKITLIRYQNVKYDSKIVTSLQWTNALRISEVTAITFVLNEISDCKS